MMNPVADAVLISKGGRSMDWVIRNLFWIIVACIAGCVLFALHLMRRGNDGEEGPNGRRPKSPAD